jgi:hypothetical protein
MLEAENKQLKESSQSQGGRGAPVVNNNDRDWMSSMGGANRAAL